MPIALFNYEGGTRSVVELRLIIFINICVVSKLLCNVVVYVGSLFRATMWLYGEKNCCSVQYGLRKCSQSHTKILSRLFCSRLKTRTKYVYYVLLCWFILSMNHNASNFLSYTAPGLLCYCFRTQEIVIIVSAVTVTLIWQQTLWPSKKWTEELRYGTHCLIWQSRGM